MRRVSVALSGIDGSGKSTIARLVKWKLRNDGRNVLVTWFRWRGFFSWILHAYARLRGLIIAVDTRDRNVKAKVNRFFLDTILRLLYPYTLFVDMILYLFLTRIRALSCRSQVVVYDRFLLDTLVDLVQTTGRREILYSFIARFFIRVANQLDLYVYLSVPPEVAYERKTDIVSKSGLVTSQKLFTIVLPGLTNVSILDARKTLGELYRDVLREIEIRLKNNREIMSAFPSHDIK